MGTVLVVVAHPDDETFGLGSAIAAAADAGHHVVVCSATRGEAGEAHGLPDGADLATVREGELRAAGAVLGASRFELLGFLDSGMAGDAEPETLVGVSYDRVVSAVRQLVDELDPDLVLTLDADYGDGHRDHVVIGRAALDACRHRPDTRVYAWAISRPLLARWFAETERLRPDSEHLDLDRAGLGRPDDEVTTLVDIRPYRRLREQAIALHASQVSPFVGMPDDIRDDILDTDRLVRLQPPWPGGPVERSLF